MGVFRFIQESLGGGGYFIIDRRFIQESLGGGGLSTYDNYGLRRSVSVMIWVHMWKLFLPHCRKIK